MSDIGNAEKKFPKPGVLALVGDCYGGNGGIAQYNQDLIEAIAPVASRIVVLPRAGSASKGQLPCGVWQLRPSFNQLVYVWAAAIATIRFRNLGVVFCGHIGMFPLAWAIARLTGARLWLQVHGVEAWPPQSGWRRWCVERADLITAVSRITRRRLLDWVSLPSYRVRVLPNTVRDGFIAGPRSKAVAERYGVVGKRILLTVGRLASTERSKGHELVMSLLPDLRRRFPDIVYLIAGIGDDQARLESVARESKLLNDVVWFIGYVPDNDLPDLYRLADLFVMPSSTEGFGIVYIEAARCGLPVIGGNRDGSVDALRNGQVGALVDATDPEALKRAIIAGLDQGRIDSEIVAVFTRPHFVKRAQRLFDALRVSTMISDV
jgi:phosphatidylinositol alpha-1,6-mannosyltransferase